MWTGPVGKIGNSGNIKFLKIHINQISTVQRTAKGTAKRKGVLLTCVSSKHCFKACFCCWFLKPCNSIQTIRWTNSNVKHLCVLRVRIRTGWNVWDSEIFSTPIDDNPWVATTFVRLSIGHRLADANGCQLTNKASIVIDWSIDFPIIGFIDW